MTLEPLPNGWLVTLSSGASLTLSHAEAEELCLEIGNRLGSERVELHHEYLSRVYDAAKFRII